MSITLFSSRDLCFTGLGIMPAFLFNPSLEARLIQALMFILFAVLLGKKVHIFFLGLVSASIIAFNLLLPHGRILTQWGPLRITEGALISGINKALTLEGLIMLSKASIRSDLRLPGFFGSLISESFRIFEKISEVYRDINWKQPIQGIDTLLIQLSELEDEHTGTQDLKKHTKTRRLIPGRIVLFTALVLSYVPLIALA